MGEAEKFCKVNTIVDCATENNFGTIPKPETWKINKDSGIRIKFSTLTT